jgi:hypothetical protein
LPQDSIQHLKRAMVVIRPGFKFQPPTAMSGGGIARKNNTASHAPPDSTAAAEKAFVDANTPTIRRTPVHFKPVVIDQTKRRFDNTNWPQIIHDGGKSLPEIISQISFGNKRPGRKRNQEGMGVKLTI